MESNHTSEPSETGDKATSHLRRFYQLLENADKEVKEAEEKVSEAMHALTLAEMQRDFKQSARDRILNDKSEFERIFVEYFLGTDFQAESFIPINMPGVVTGKGDQQEDAGRKSKRINVKERIVELLRTEQNGLHMSAIIERMLERFKDQITEKTVKNRVSDLTNEGTLKRVFNSGNGYTFILREPKLPHHGTYNNLVVNPKDVLFSTFSKDIDDKQDEEIDEEWG